MNLLAELRSSAQLLFGVLHLRDVHEMPQIATARPVGVGEEQR